MHTEAVFENIADRIKVELSQAKSSIYIAVAWFTNERLFQLIKTKAKAGAEVYLMITDDEINENSSINFKELTGKHSNFYLIGGNESVLMHNKFCVIDRKTVITGSYNWSYKAESNHENIVINYDDVSLAQQFVTEFIAIRNKYFPQEKSQRAIADFPVDKIIKRLEILKNFILLEKRLEILKNFILLEDIDDCLQTTEKLKEYRFNETIEAIITNLQNQNFGEAVEGIQAFLKQYQQLTIWNDPELQALRLEIKILESQINAFENEKTDLEKTLTDFQNRHTKELGEIILEILKLRRQKLWEENKEKAREAEEDYNNYRKQYDSEMEKDVLELNEEQKAELKKQYRIASVLCHPDKFMNEPEEVKEMAEEMFKELNEANSRNDLKRVAEILDNLNKGILTPANSSKIDDKQKLKDTITKLKEKLRRLEKEIEAVKKSDTYQKLEDITDWDKYFEETKELLYQELKDLQGWKITV